MRFTPDRCLGCGIPTSERFLTIGGYWFHSAKCYREAYSKFLDKDYAHGKIPFDSEEMKAEEEEFDDHFDRLKVVEDCIEYEEADSYEYACRLVEDHKHRVAVIKSEWLSRQGREIEKAKAELHKRIEAEAKHLNAEQEAKDRVVREKAEQRRKAQEAEQEKWRPRPFKL